MRRARATGTGAPAAAERLWRDPQRWASFIDGFGHVAKLDESWPEVGSTVVWDSLPQHRGRVIERVLAYEPGRGQTVEVEDERLRGTQAVVFERVEEGVGISLTLDYELKQRNPFTPLVDLIFIRRALGESLRGTLVRFERELAAEYDVLR